MAYHAKLSPSGAKRWAICTASPAAEVGLPDNAQAVTYWGTAAHLVGSTSLETGKDPAHWLGEMVRFLRGPDGNTFEVLGSQWPTEYPEAASTQERYIMVDAEMVACATEYVNFVRDLVVTTGGELLVEQKLPIGQVTGEAGATGTGDTCILASSLRQIIVVDLKGGFGYVSAYESVAAIAIAHPNLRALPEDIPNFQLGMYGLGALEQYGLFGEWDTVRLVIVQPRISGRPSEYVISVAALREFGAWLSVQADEVRNNPTYRPGEDQCHFCRAKATCQALQAHALSDMPDLDTLVKPKRGQKLAVPEGLDLAAIVLKKPLIEMLLEAVVDRVRSDLQAGRAVPRVKLVEGRKGARSWKDEDAAARALLAAGVDCYSKSLITPTEAEKLVTDIGQWENIAALVDDTKRTQPVIVLESDPRPSITVGDMPIDESDLFNN